MLRKEGVEERVLGEECIDGGPGGNGLGGELVGDGLGGANGCCCSEDGVARNGVRGE